MTHIALIAATFLLAGFVKGMIGMGLPLVAVGLLGLVMAPAQAASLLIVPSMVTNVWQLAVGPGLRPLVRRLWPMLLCVAMGTLVTSGFIAGDAVGAKIILGVALIVYAVIGLAAFHPTVPPRAERWLGPVTGLVTGAISGATGVFSVPSVPYIQGLGLEREALIQALGLSFTVSTVALAAGLAAGGAFDTSTLTGSVLVLAPSLAGMFMGQWVRVRVHPTWFRRCFFVGLLALGADLALRAALHGQDV